MPRTIKLGTSRSRALRKRLTEAERRLWWYLERIPLADTHFRKQAPIGPYVADFVCHKAKLILEVDGRQHGLEAGLQADAARSAWLASQGYRVLRFWNHEVMNQIDVVLDTIYAALYTAFPNGVGADTPTPVSDETRPSPQGGGNRAAN